MLSAPDLTILCSALFGDKTYSLGAIVARHLSKNRTKGIIYGSVYASCLAAPNVYGYNLVFSQATREIITLPAPALFDLQVRGRYFIMPADITNYKNALAAAHDEEIHPWEA